MSDKHFEPPSGGLKLEDAIEAFADSKLWSAYREALREASKPRPAVPPLAHESWVGDGVLDSVGQRRRKRYRRPAAAAENKKEEAWQAVCADLWAQLASGDLAAWGRKGDPTAPWRWIPPDSFKSLRTGNVPESIIRGPDGLKLYSVEIRRAVDSPGIIGKAAAETQCRRWLQGLAKVGDPTKPKRDYLSDAKSRFGEKLSRRGFDRAWAGAREINPNWGKAGAKPRSPR